MEFKVAEVLDKYNLASGINRNIMEFKEETTERTGRRTRRINRNIMEFKAFNF